MRTLSEVRESILWILKLLFERQLQSCKERISLSVPPCWVRSFTHRGVSIGVYVGEDGILHSVSGISSPQHCLAHNTSPIKV